MNKIEALLQEKKKYENLTHEVVCYATTLDFPFF